MHGFRPPARRAAVAGAQPISLLIQIAIDRVVSHRTFKTKRNLTGRAKDVSNRSTTRSTTSAILDVARR
jgi:hypothetical protein